MYDLCFEHTFPAFFFISLALNAIEREGMLRYWENVFRWLWNTEYIQIKQFRISFSTNYINLSWHCSFYLVDFSGSFRVKLSLLLCLCCLCCCRRWFFLYFIFCCATYALKRTLLSLKCEWKSFTSLIISLNWILLILSMQQF